MEKFGKFVSKLHFRRLLQVEGRNVFRPQSNISNGAFLDKYWKPLTIFAKASCCIYDWVLSTSLEGFVQDSPWEELVIAPVVECLKTSGKSITNKLAVSSTMDALLKTQIIVDVFW